jgi:cell wall-associated NlpC family hydrolase
VTERTTGRHRAPQKSSTPLSTLTGSLSAVGDYVGSVRRSGVIIAMSSGLVASVAMPAHAVDAPPQASGSATASIPVVPPSSDDALHAVPEGGMLVLPPDLAPGDGALVALAAATVEFDHSSFTLVPGGQQTLPGSDDDSVWDGVSQLPTSLAPAPVTRKQRRQAVPAVAAPSTPDATRDETQVVSVTQATAVKSTGLGSRVVAIAFRYRGTPYLWGGTSPRGFDCSGFTKYVYARAGKELGRTVADQRSDVKFVSRSRAKPGDLIFFGSSHVAIYLGGNRMIDSPHRGARVQARKIYSANVQFGHVV